MPPEFPGSPSRDGQQLSSPGTGSYILSTENNRKGCAVQRQNAPDDASAIKQLAEQVPGIAQIPTASRIDADIEAICELQKRIESLWGNLTAASREDLSARLDLLGTAADHRATDTRQVREALQEVVLSIGTGALAVLSDPTRQRLTALTGITLPGHLSATGYRSAAEMPEDQGSAPGTGQLAGLPAATTDKGAGK
jgi:hypothetical protein